jgi:hypothetical protein
MSNKPIQIRIPSPCHENWDSMEPSAKGRHCAVCQKTVVDFTTMSDAEVIRYMATAGPNVCGRLATDQIDRQFIPLAPPMQNRLAGLQVLLAGLLLTSDGSMPCQPASRGIHQQPTIMKNYSTDEHMAGLMEIQVGKLACSEEVPVPKAGATTEADTVWSEKATMGEISVVPPVPPRDTILIQSTDSTFLENKKPIMQGGIIATTIGNDDSIKQILTDTLKQIITDTLTALHLIHVKKLTIYPNPVPRGTSFHIAWQTDPGTYQVSLFNTAGALIQKRIIEVSGPTQTDSWGLPPNLSAGVYILRAIRQGQTENYSRKILVE